MVHEHKIYNGSASHSENSVFLLKAAFYAKRFCIESKVAYYYFQREDSSVHVFDYKKFSGELCSFKEQMEIAQSTISKTPTYLDFIGKKILFLMRRYDELQDIKELKSFRKEYLNTLADELDQVKDKNKLRKYGRRVGLLLDHKVGSYIFLNRFKNVVAVGQKCKKTVVSKLKDMFYRVEESTATHKNIDYLEYHSLKNIRHHISLMKKNLFICRVTVDALFSARSSLNLIRNLRLRISMDLQRITVNIIVICR